MCKQSKCCAFRPTNGRLPEEAGIAGPDADDSASFGARPHQLCYVIICDVMQSRPGTGRLPVEACIAASDALTAAAHAAAGLVATAHGGAGARAATLRELTSKRRMAAVHTACGVVIRGAYHRVGGGPGGVTGTTAELTVQAYRSFRPCGGALFPSSAAFLFEAAWERFNSLANLSRSKPAWPLQKIDIITTGIFHCSWQSSWWATWRAAS